MPMDFARLQHNFRPCLSDAVGGCEPCSCSRPFTSFSSIGATHVGGGEMQGDRSRPRLGEVSNIRSKAGINPREAHDSKRPGRVIRRIKGQEGEAIPVFLPTLSKTTWHRHPPQLQTTVHNSCQYIALIIAIQRILVSGELLSVGWENAVLLLSQDGGILAMALMVRCGWHASLVRSLVGESQSMSTGHSRSTHCKPSKHCADGGRVSLDSDNGRDDEVNISVLHCARDEISDPTTLRLSKAALFGSFHDRIRVDSR